MEDFTKQLDSVFMVEELYKVPKAKREKYRKLNPKTNRRKNFKKIAYHTTKIPPNKRTFKNKPDNVRFQDWMLIKPEKAEPSNNVSSVGKSEADGKWYGWSHRAVYGFKTREQAVKFADSVS